MVGIWQVCVWVVLQCGAPKIVNLVKVTITGGVIKGTYLSLDEIGNQRTQQGGGPLNLGIFPVDIAELREMRRGVPNRIWWQNRWELVGGLVAIKFLFSHSYWVYVIIPIDEIIFFRPGFIPWPTNQYVFRWAYHGSHDAPRILETNHQIQFRDFLWADVVINFVLPFPGRKVLKNTEGY